MKVTRRACLGASLGIGGLIAGGPIWSADEPTSTRGEIELTRQKIETNRTEIIQEGMELTDTESTAFWPVYRQFRVEKNKIGDDMVKLIDEYLHSYENLTDDQAKKIVDDWFKLRERALKTDKSYVEKFRKVLPQKKVARLYRLEFAMDSVIMLGITVELPDAT